MGLKSGETTHILRAYYFALKIIFVILNKTTQHISFVSITLFITFFFIIKQGLFLYEDIFINSLKGLYPEFITSSSSLSKKLEAKYPLDKIKIKNEIFVHSEEVEFSYDSQEDITKFMNVRTYDEEYKDKLFNTLTIKELCDQKPNTIWISSRLYDNMSQDSIFNKRSIFFRDEDDNYHEYNLCKFDLNNNEKWLLVSTKLAKKIAYMPFAKHVIYTNDKQIKDELYKTKGVHTWKQYIDYDDLGVFLLAKEVSSTFLITFFIFLITFMIIAFSSLAKEFESSVFLIKLYGLNIFRTVLLYSFFFLLYTIAIAVCVYIEYTLITFFIQLVAHFSMPFDLSFFMMILEILVAIGFAVSVFIALKYHRLPL